MPIVRMQLQFFMFRIIEYLALKKDNFLPSFIVYICGFISFMQK